MAMESSEETGVSVSGLVIFWCFRGVEGFGVSGALGVLGTAVGRFRVLV